MSARALGVNSQVEPQSKEQGWAELSVLETCNLISLKILYHHRHLTILQVENWTARSLSPGFPVLCS